MQSEINKNVSKVTRSLSSANGEIGVPFVQRICRCELQDAEKVLNEIERRGFIRSLDDSPGRYKVLVK